MPPRVQNTHPPSRRAEFRYRRPGVGCTGSKKACSPFGIVEGGEDVVGDVFVDGLAVDEGIIAMSGPPEVPRGTGARVFLALRASNSRSCQTTFKDHICAILTSSGSKKQYFRLAELARCNKLWTAYLLRSCLLKLHFLLRVALTWYWYALRIDWSRLLSHLSHYFHPLASSGFDLRIAIFS